MNEAPTAERRTVWHRAGHVAVPVVLAVLTWLLVLLTVGRLLRFEGPLSLFSLLVVMVLSSPLVAFAPWRNGVGERVIQWSADHLPELSITAVLTVLLAVPAVIALLGPLATIFQFPLRLSGTFYGATLPFRQHVGPTFGTVLLRVSQWYVQVLWLFVIATALTRLAAPFWRARDAG